MQNNYSNHHNHQVMYAGFFVRMAAYLIDTVIVAGLLLAVRIPLWIASMVLPGDVFGQQILFSYSLKDILLYLFGAAYYILLTYYTGATIGKRLLNIRVVAADGGKLSWTNVIYRETVGRFLCSFLMGIGYIMAGMDGQKQGLHDMICDTRVIYEKRVKVTVVDNRPRGTGYHPDGAVDAKTAQDVMSLQQKEARKEMLKPPQTAAVQEVSEAPQTAAAEISVPPHEDYENKEGES